MANHNVVVYSTPKCPYCVLAKRYLDSKKVSYQDIDVSADQQKAMEMVQKTGQMGVPTIEIDDKIIVGFQPQVMESLLA
jgi:glutaredoxin-like YruB-family protein